MGGGYTTIEKARIIVGTEAALANTGGLPYRPSHFYRRK